MARARVAMCGMLEPNPILRLRLATWNVLHRIHAQNWGESPLSLYPEEQERLAEVAGRVLSLLGSGCQIIALQEVSGDLLGQLHARLPPEVQVFEHTYSRLPRLREPTPGPAPLKDPSEHLVTLVSGHEARRGRAQDADNDPGKGFLAVHLGERCVVINAHVSGRERGRSQLEMLAREALANPGPAVIVGDFNVQPGKVREAMPPPFELADHSGQRATRTGGGGQPDSWIDHVVGLRATIEEIEVVDAGRCSDHNPVRAAVALR